MSIVPDPTAAAESRQALAELNALRASLSGMRGNLRVREVAAGRLAASPIRDHVAAVSVGICQGVPVLDLDYREDSTCDTDMNVVMNDAGGFIEVQGTAEGHAFRRDELDALLALAEQGVSELVALQRAALAS